MAWKQRGGSPWDTVPPAGGTGGAGDGGEDLVGRVQNRFQSLLPPSLRQRGLAAIVLGLFLVFLFFTSFYRVQPAEQGVVQRFGQWVRTEPQGFHVKWPVPIETVTIVDVAKVRRVDIGFRTEQEMKRSRTASLLEERLMLTGDENIVDIAFTVFWVVSDAKKFLFNIQSPQDKTVKEVAESVMREIVGKTQIQIALTQGRTEIQSEAAIKLQQVLDSYGSGVRVTEIRLERVDPPAEVIDAFRDVQAAAADRERLQNEAQAYANSIVPEARGQAVRMIQEAEAYKQQVIARSTGEAARFVSVYLEYAKARDVTKRRIYLETMEDILTGMNKIIVDGKAGSGVVPYLPLPELNTKTKQSKEEQ